MRVWNWWWLFVPYVLSVLVLAFVLLVFNKSFQEVTGLIAQVPLLNGLTYSTHSGSVTIRTPAFMERDFQLLKRLRSGCLTPANLTPRMTFPIPKAAGPIRLEDGSDLRGAMWTLKARGLESGDCAFNSLPADLAHVFHDKTEFIELVRTQWSRVSRSILHAPYLLELELSAIPASVKSFGLLSLGIMNGTTAVFLNDELVAFFLERIDSGRLISVKLREGLNKLSLVNYAEGFPYPGISHVSFIGLLGHNDSRTDLFPNNYERNHNITLTISVTSLLSLVLFVFGVYQLQKMQWPIWLALSLVAFSLTRAVDLDHVQSNLDGIRYYRAFAISMFLLASIQIVRELLGRMERLVAELNQGEKKTNWREWLQAFSYGWRIALIVIIGLSGRAIFSTLGFLPTGYVAQYEALAPMSAWIVIIASLMLAAATWMLFVLPRAAEDAQALIAKEIFQISSVSGTCLLLYITSYRDFLATWLKLEKVPAIGSLLSSQAIPFLVAVTVLFLMGRILREQLAFRKIVPASIQEMIPRVSSNPLSLDQTETEFNWILLNDIVGSSGFKMNNLAIVTHMLQSVFHKLHKDYFKDSIHFINSIGDAILLAIKAPKKCQKDDPILEKLVRSYSLHRDGVQTMSDSYMTIISLLRLHNRELHFAIEDRIKVSGDGLKTVFSFRTILTADYYFYGLNHELSNIDSKSIYVISKSEKLIRNSTDGGFVIFPDLMGVLANAFSGLSEFFEKEEIDRSRAAEALRSFLPSHAFVLKQDKKTEFEAFLEGYYGKVLYLRAAPDTGVSYQNVGIEVLHFCAQLGTASDLLDLLGLIQGPVPKFKSFVEKNQVINSLTSAAVKFEIWEDREAWDSIMSFLLNLGIPGATMLRSVSDRDRKNDPDLLLKGLSSSDPVRRNHAVRFLKLARVRNQFRPRAMERKEFAREVFQIYVKSLDRFSVESHWYFHSFIFGSEELKDVVFEQFSSIDGQGLHENLQKFFSSHPAPSMKRLADIYRIERANHQTPSKAA